MTFVTSKNGKISSEAKTLLIPTKLSKAIKKAKKTYIGSKKRGKSMWTPTVTAISDSEIRIAAKRTIDNNSDEFEYG